MTGSSQVPRAEHQPIIVQPSAPTDTKLDYLARHSRMVDQLYEELMRWAAALRAGFDRCLNGRLGAVVPASGTTPRYNSSLGC